MRRIIFLAIGILSLLAGFWYFTYLLLEGKGNLFTVFAAYLIFGAALAAIAVSLYDHVALTAQGIVMAHYFEPGENGEAEWLLHLKNAKGRERIVGFPHDVHNDYPVGSFYPRSKSQTRAL